MRTYIEKQLKALKAHRAQLLATKGQTKGSYEYDRWYGEWAESCGRLNAYLLCLEALPSAIQQVRQVTPQAIKDAEKSIESLEALRSFPQTRQQSSDNASCMMREMKLIEQLKNL